MSSNYARPGHVLLVETNILLLSTSLHTDPCDSCEGVLPAHTTRASALRESHARVHYHPSDTDSILTRLPSATLAFPKFPRYSYGSGLVPQFPSPPPYYGLTSSLNFPFLPNLLNSCVREHLPPQTEAGNDGTGEICQTATTIICPHRFTFLDD